ncbi:SCO6745 family protein [Actinomadura yumaensis]|uniref:SalK n=1 Tax=Actinomadura yumaensis TaxID=111807 RepID=A0ABW2CJ82_9ACTN
MDDSFAREIWKVVEPVHAVTYFAPECIEAHKAAGLRGFWMGYFGSRGAPLGPVGPGVIEATFYGFHPARVRRAVPDAWSFAEPQAILRARTEGAARALRRLVPGVDGIAESVVPLLETVVTVADGAGRALFSANRDLPAVDDPVGRLWQATTALREHRGDGHVALLAGEGLDGLQANVLASETAGVPAERLRESRGWSEDEWAAAVEAMTASGLMAADGVTALGREVKARIEARTDELAARPYRALDDPQALVEALSPAARGASEVIRFPNPIGLPRT